MRLHDSDPFGVFKCAIKMRQSLAYRISTFVSKKRQVLCCSNWLRAKKHAAGRTFNRTKKNMVDRV